jgi:PD-(D/E)XK endonuclease
MARFTRSVPKRGLNRPLASLVLGGQGGAKKSRRQQLQAGSLVRGPLNSKAKGELGELAFVHKAATLGFGVAKPHGDNERYDFIVDSGERLWRVQVKTTCKVHDHRYQTSSRHGQGADTKPYKAREIDFIVAYIVPRHLWYVIPVDSVAASTALSFYPTGCRQGSGRFEPYREAWHLMAPGGDLTPQPGILRRVRAMGCEGKYLVWETPIEYEFQLGPAPAGTPAPTLAAWGRS